MPRKQIFILLIFLLCCWGCSKAQKLTSITPNGELRVTISPKTPAIITLYQGNTKSQQIIVNSNKGEFSIVDLDAGEYLVQIACSGYQTSQQKVTVSQAEITKVEVVLTPIPSTEPEPPNELEPPIEIEPPVETEPPVTQPPDGEPEFAAGEILVGFVGSITLEEAQQIVNSQGLKADWGSTIQLSSFWVRVYVPAETEQYWIDIFKKLEKVKYAELNYTVYAAL